MVTTVCSGSYQPLMIWVLIKVLRQFTILYFIGHQVYAFEFAGTFEKYSSSSGTEDKGFTTGKATRYYNIYFAHDVLYWIQRIHTYGWHLTPSIELSDYSIGVNLNTTKASMFQDFQTNSAKVWFKNNLTRIDYLCRTMRYGLNFGRSFHRL